eukprot:6198743-Pleurochrysis_carterae.AAC.1
MGIRTQRDGSGCLFLCDEAADALWEVVLTWSCSLSGEGACCVEGSSSLWRAGACLKQFLKGIDG